MKTYILSILIIFLLFASCKQQGGPEKPNVLFILADDLGAHDLSHTGSKYYETPNIDMIASQGMVFTQGYAACRVCSPSRASIMTGKFPARHGITDWIGARSGIEWRSAGRYDKLLPADYIHNLPHEDISLAEAMKDAGYKTFFAGKWHLGTVGSHPEDHGFDINKGGWDVGSPRGGYYSPYTNPKLENRRDGENLSMRLAEETVSFLEVNKDSAFLAYLSFYAVHGPIQTTKEKWSKYRDKAELDGIAETGFQMERVLPIRTEQDNPVYAGLVESMDDAVGLVLNSLKELGLEENTIVIFTSDNGGVASGDAFSTSNTPLRGGKGYMWEGGIREPYFIMVPWLNSNGMENSYPVTGTDFYPTILDLANIDLLPDQHVDGVSLKPLLEGKILPERPLYWHYPHYGNQGGEPSSILRENEWKLIHYWEDGRDELYNLQSDPGELNDVSGDNPDITKKMNQQLLSWLTEVGARFPVPDEEYNAELDSLRDIRIINQQWPYLEKQRMDFLSKDFDPGNKWWGSDVSTVD